MSVLLGWAPITRSAKRVWRHLAKHPGHRRASRGAAGLTDPEDFAKSFHS